MLELFIEGVDLYDERNAEFVSTKDTTLRLEHSLISLTKWESKWHKPFLGNEQRTEEEIRDYVRCMTITQNVDPKVYLGLTQEHYKKIEEYMSDPMTATWFNDKNNPRSKQKVVTAELIYYWMISLQIPFECERWHLNRLLTLIRVCNNENTPKKKMRTGDVFKQNAQLNEARRKMMRSRG